MIRCKTKKAVHEILADRLDTQNRKREYGQDIRSSLREKLIYLEHQKKNAERERMTMENALEQELRREEEYEKQQKQERTEELAAVYQNQQLV